MKSIFKQVVKATWQEDMKLVQDLYKQAKDLNKKLKEIADDLEDDDLVTFFENRAERMDDLDDLLDDLESLGRKQGIRL